MNNIILVIFISLILYWSLVFKSYTEIIEIKAIVGTIVFVALSIGFITAALVEWKTRTVAFLIGLFTPLTANAPFWIYEEFLKTLSNLIIGPAYAGIEGPVGPNAAQVLGLIIIFSFAYAIISLFGAHYGVSMKQRWVGRKFKNFEYSTVLNLLFAGVSALAALLALII